MDKQENDPVRVVAFGGGHGLGASLSALAEVDGLDLTAVVTVGDDGGSSGRLRAELGTLPPGDLRQALAALAAPVTDAGAVAALFQYRFQPGADPDHPRTLAGHAIGNLVLCGLFEKLGDPVAALDHAAAMVQARGRVLPMSPVPVTIEADMRSSSQPFGPIHTIAGQHSVAVAEGRLEAVRLNPIDPPACAEAVRAVEHADWLIFGPGSWYTSVIPHLLVPDLAKAIMASPAKRLVILNLAEEKETKGLSLSDHLNALTRYLPGLRADVVLADQIAVGDPDPVRRAAEELGASLLLAPIARADGTPRHDPVALTATLAPIVGRTIA
jgi:uncharacterized cofD-like protein